MGWFSYKLDLFLLPIRQLQIELKFHRSSSFPASIPLQPEAIGP